MVMRWKKKKECLVASLFRAALERPSDGEALFLYVTAFTSFFPFLGRSPGGSGPVPSVWVFSRSLSIFMNTYDSSPETQKWPLVPDGKRERQQETHGCCVPGVS